MTNYKSSKLFNLEDRKRQTGKPTTEVDIFQWKSTLLEELRRRCNKLYPCATIVRLVIFFCACDKKNTLQPCVLPLLVLDFVVSMHFCTPPFIFISLLPAFNNSNDSLVYCAWQTKNVPAKKSCGLCRLWRSG